jgi:arylsulfatase A
MTSSITPIAILVYLAAFGAAPITGGPHQPNVILIIADDLGHECLGTYGSKQYRTPNLDRLAAEGVRFDHAYAAPICTPTRVMLMTGKYNHRNYTYFAQYPAGQRCFAQMMKQAGYATAVVDKWQLGQKPGPTELGFDEWCLFNYGQLGSPGAKERYWHPAIGANGKTIPTVEKDYGPDIFLKYCQDFVRRNRERPFFLYWPMGIPHDPFDATPDSQDTTVRGDRRMYPDMVAYMDKVIGKLIATVDELGLAERTLIIFTGDNGTPHGIFSELGGRELEGGKGSMKDAGTHVPLIARWTGVIPPSTVRDDLITLVDIYPTLAELAGADVSRERLDGTSLLPWMRGQPGKPREWIFISFKSQWANTQTGQHNVSAWVRDHRWKLYNNGRLYDLEHDPDETTPAAGPEPEAARAKLQPVFAQVAATPEALKQFRDSNVRSQSKKPPGKEK